MSGLLVKLIKRDKFIYRSQGNNFRKQFKIRNNSGFFQKLWVQVIFPDYLDSNKLFKKMDIPERVKF